MGKVDIKEVKIREVNKEDLLEIFYWRNDPTTIEMSLGGKSVSLEEHKIWFYNVIKNKGIKMYFGEFKNNGFGVIRFDQSIDNKNIHLITINIAPNKRGFGLGKILLSQSISKLWENSPNFKCVKAQIRESNLKSQKLFESCKFKLLDMKNDIKTYSLER